MWTADRLVFLPVLLLTFLTAVEAVLVMLSTSSASLQLLTIEVIRNLATVVAASTGYRTAHIMTTTGSLPWLKKASSLTIDVMLECCTILDLASTSESVVVQAENVAVLAWKLIEAGFEMLAVVR